MRLPADGPNEFICPECRFRCTNGAITGRELGHAAGHSGGKERCSRRPASCDPSDKTDAPSYWGGQGFAKTEAV